MTTEKTEKTKKRNKGPNFEASEKCQAVLAIWTEKCKPADICRQLGINWMILNQWQERALEGMMQALESRVKLSEGQCLSPRLQALLRKRQNGCGAPKLEERLTRIQELKGALVEKHPRKVGSEK